LALVQGNRAGCPLESGTLVLDGFGGAKLGSATTGTITTPTSAQIVGTVFPGDTNKDIQIVVANTSATARHVTDVVAKGSAFSGSITGSDGSCSGYTWSGAGGEYVVPGSPITSLSKHGLSLVVPSGGSPTVLTITGFISLVDPNMVTGCSNGQINVPVLVTMGP
jgi:hypothetical protein